VALAPLEEEIRRFLSVDTPEVICIRGKWGVGKTFAWNAYLRAARDAGRIGLSRYSYVSLFGMNTLEELRYSIFENAVRASEIGVNPSIKTLNENAGAAVESLGRKSLWFLQQLPFVKSHIGGLGPVWYLSVNGYIVCIDDIERKGGNFPIRDVFGLISQLKEQKRCKVVLILNDDALKDETEDLAAYFDKTIDASLVFEPSAEEATKIALSPQVTGNELIAKNCISLGISNIRIIKRIERLVAAIHPLLTNYDEQIFAQAAHSLTLFAWSKYEPGVAPPMKFIRERHNLALMRAVERVNTKKEPEIPGDEAEWTAALDTYNFSMADEFDLALAKGVDDGFFTAEQIGPCAAALDRRIKAGKSEQAAGEGWELFHDSFGDNQDVVMEKMFDNILGNIEFVTPINLSGTIVFLKELGYKDAASKLIAAYVQTRREDPSFFDLSRYPFAREITDPELRDAFYKKQGTINQERDPTEILYKIGKGSGWGEQEVELLATIPTEAYYEIFKANSGEKLRALLKGSLHFGNFGGASEAMQQISQHAIEALTRIGRESAINEMRVRRYGVGARKGDAKDAQ
jgi:hypothetical protein